MQQGARLIWGGLILFLAGLVIPILMLTGYVFLNTTFTDAFCENTDRPELKCNGSCAAMKVLQIDEEREQQSDSFPAGGELVKFLESFSPVEFSFSAWDDCSLNTFAYHEFVRIGFTARLDRPPAC